MSSEIEHIKEENDFLKAEVLRLKNQIESDAYKVILDSSPDIIIQLDLSYKVLIIHIPFIPKGRLQALVGKNIFDITPAYAHEKMVVALEDVFEQGKVVQYESEGITLGAYRYYDNYVAPIRNELDEIRSAYFVSRDITIQKEAEKILRQSERKLKTVYENSIQFLTILDLERKFVWFNKNALDRSPTGSGNPFMIGEAVESYIEKSKQHLFISNFNRAVAGEVVIYNRTYTIDTQNIFFEYTLSPIYEDAEVVGVSLIGINVTKHKEYEEYLKRVNVELISQNEQLNHYSHIISHNLRGPIATLMGLVELFEQEKDNPIQVQELMHLVYKSALNFDIIIKDLTEVVSYDEQKGTLLSKIDLHEECKLIEFLLSAQIKDANAQVLYDFDKYHSFFSIKSYIHSILYNLVSNGIKYKRTNVLPIIRLSCHKINEKEVCIKCEDNGLGLDLDKYGHKLFGFYKRFHSHVEGKGLGLHLVKKQVDLLGGRIEVESKVNEGMTFKIFLPI